MIYTLLRNPAVTYVRENRLIGYVLADNISNVPNYAIDALYYVAIVPHQLYLKNILWILFPQID